MAADQASHARRRLEYQKSYSLEVQFIIVIICIVIAIIVFVTYYKLTYNSTANVVVINDNS